MFNESVTQDYALLLLGVLVTTVVKQGCIQLIFICFICDWVAFYAVLASKSNRDDRLAVMTVS